MHRYPEIRAIQNVEILRTDLHPPRLSLSPLERLCEHKIEVRRTRSSKNIPARIAIGRLRWCEERALVKPTLDRALLRREHAGRNSIRAAIVALGVDGRAGHQDTERRPCLRFQNPAQLPATQDAANQSHALPSSEG